MAINEGPVILKRNGKVFLVFSASACWSDDYSLGMLTTSETDDVMERKSWIKAPGPVFWKSVENRVFGPGHNSFTTSPDNTEDWIVYHAIDVSGGGAKRRSTRVQKFTWYRDGTSDLGTPAPLDKDFQLPSNESATGTN